ncbi:fungal hydrophobin [Heliocybe sulcata]|uniref:Hydrophobin n=1 Tax=Heliocybe sulcata TaxID=5364 RepID=A0A5C3N6H8_9AGAM|nr:fungal hydrophobin [Heliocybe sulcata]
MKVTAVVAVLVACVLSVEALATPTNADRMARGLPPMPPKKRLSNRVHQARHKPSGAPPPPPTPTPTPPASGNSGSCNTGPVQCCNSVQKAGDGDMPGILGLLGLSASSADALVGTNCSPISALGLGGGASCDAHPVCCENNAQGGLISIGCIPITL